MDFSTINLDVLRSLPQYKIPPSYHLQKDSGNGCYGDAPGYPTYFTRSVYDKDGNNPSRGPYWVITFEDVVAGGRVHYVTSSEWAPGDTWEKCHARQEALFRRLWLPLPLDHERVKLWIAETYRHHATCYYDDSKPERDNDHTLIYPVPSYKLAKFVDDERFSDDWRTKAKAEIEARNHEIIRYAGNVAVPENHSAVRIIRRFYPEHQPDLDLIAHPPTKVVGQWWETEAQRPTPETCRPRSIGPHPINTTWCQWCGWYSDSEEK